MIRSFCDRCGVEGRAHKHEAAPKVASITINSARFDLCGRCRTELADVVRAFIDEKAYPKERA